MTSHKKIFISSPLGFSEVGKLFLYEKIIPIIESAGYIVVDPWKLTSDEEIQAVERLPYGMEKKKKWALLNGLIGERNAKAIEESQGMLAILDGVDVDSGTAAEIGYAAALKKPILGYRGDFRLSADNEGCIVNLQVEYFIRKNGGSIITDIDSLKSALKALFG